MRAGDAAPVYSVPHVAQVAVDPLGEPVGFRAVCSCGWDGELRSDEASATDDLNDHLEVAVGLATGLDVVVNELLNLTDDVVEVVGWLATHWSDDLPTLRWYGNGHQGGKRPALTLAGGCMSSADLAQVAELLDVAAADDVEPDSVGHRYRRAVRDFGQVQIEVIYQFADGGTGDE